MLYKHILLGGERLMNDNYSSGNVVGEWHSIDFVDLCCVVSVRDYNVDDRGLHKDWYHQYSDYAR